MQNIFLLLYLRPPEIWNSYCKNVDDIALRLVIQVVELVRQQHQMWTFFVRGITKLYMYMP